MKQNIIEYRANKLLSVKQDESIVRRFIKLFTMYKNQVTIQCLESLRTISVYSVDSLIQQDEDANYVCFRVNFLDKENRRGFFTQVDFVACDYQSDNLNDFRFEEFFIINKEEFEKLYKIEREIIFLLDNANKKQQEIKNLISTFLSYHIRDLKKCLEM